MNNEDAKKILALYRPGTADRSDPDFREALAQTGPLVPKNDGRESSVSELDRWFHTHCSAHAVIRVRFTAIPVPVGLQERILAECKMSAPPMRIFPLIVDNWLKIAAVLAVCLGLVLFSSRFHHSENEFTTYKNRMARVALRPYGMALESHDLAVIQSFLAGRKAPSDYVLPEGIIKAQPIGCAVLKWQGQPVSMLCFHSDRTLPPGEKTDLWLFVINEVSLPGEPQGRSPVIAPITKLTTATWTQGGKTYMLAAAGDKEFLQKFF